MVVKSMSVLVIDSEKRILVERLRIDPNYAGMINLPTGPWLAGTSPEICVESILYSNSGKHAILEQLLELEIDGIPSYLYFADLAQPEKEFRNSLFFVELEEFVKSMKEHEYPEHLIRTIKDAISSKL